MHALWILSLPERVSIATTDYDGLRVEFPGGRLELRGISSARREALRHLSYPGRPLRDLLQTVELHGTAGERVRLLHDLRTLMRRFLLQFHVRVADRHIATLAPTSPSFVVGQAKTPSGRFVLSRFAYLNCSSDMLMLESPLSAARVVLHDRYAAMLLHAISRPVSMHSLSASESGLSSGALDSLIRLLNSAQLLTDVAEDGRRAEDERPGLKFWEFHDLLFHARSRVGRHDQAVGGTYRWAGTADLPPAVKTTVGSDSIACYRPDLDKLQHSDPSYARVSEERCSVREYGSEPLTVEQLGEFLFRAARVREAVEFDVDTYAGSVRMEFTTRPYPSAGGLYELEVYPLVQACGGLDAGLYHYNPQEHRLFPVAASEQLRGELLQDAASAAGIDVMQLQVLLILSARFPRVMWKYASMAYAAILKNVGVAYQAMYLAATAMQLAPCALGTGDSDLFSRAVGSDYYEETSVGELLLGSLPPGGPEPWIATDEDGNT